MTNYSKILSLSILLFGLIGSSAHAQKGNDISILSHTVDLNKQDLQFYWKNDNGANFKDFKALKDWLKTNSKELVFAMNGGMYKTDLSPQGLYIEKGIIKSKIDSVKSGYGNFYMLPNGIFYITNNNVGHICKTENFQIDNIKFATQSGPLLIINGEIHSKFRNGSKNLNVRNGVGILPDGNIVFAMSKEKVNFYDFANYFKSLGCNYALYLDGFVSKTYLPQKGYLSTEGNFGVIIGEAK